MGSQVRKRHYKSLLRSERRYFPNLPQLRRTNYVRSVRDEPGKARSLLRVAMKTHGEHSIMDKSRIIGSAKELKGATKEAIGKATGDAKLQAEGKTDQAEGKLQNAIGGVNDALRALKK
jgi:uncharacterized protein YjbJ (UPF0337 family)